MTFPTTPTAAGSRVLTAVDTAVAGTRTFPSLSGLTKNSGDLLIAIVVAYQSSATANAVWSAWGGGFTEFGDQSTTTGMTIGLAYKFSTGSETGTFTVTEGATVTGAASMILMSIAGASPTVPPEFGGYAHSETTSAANPASVSPSWGALDTLWVSVAGTGEIATTGSYTGLTTAPTNYSGAVLSGISSDVVGGCDAGVAFRQVNASSEDVGTWTLDTSSTRNAALLIAVRPNTNATATPSVVAGSTAIPTPLVNAVNVLASVVAAAATVAALTGNIVPNLDARVSIPTPTISDGSASVNIHPSVVNGVATVGSPGVSTGSATVTPTRVSAVASIATPAVQGNPTWFTVIGGTTPSLIVSAEDWGLLPNATLNHSGDATATFDDYFASRAAQGYNAVEVSLFSYSGLSGSNDSGQDADGVYPFNTNSNNPSNSINTTWWARRDAFFASAASNGFRVFCNLTTPELNVGAFTASWTGTQWTDLGNKLSARYASGGSYDHVFWIVADDYFFTIDSGLNNLLTALRAGGANQPISIQWYQEASSRYNIYTGSSADGASNNWATGAQYNWGYSYNPSYDVVEKMGNESNPIPYLWADGIFLGSGTTGITDKQMLRRMVWWALSSGSKGFQVGDNNMWTWPSTALAEVTSNTFYTAVVPAISTYFRSLTNWHRLKADTSSQLVTAGRGTHVTAIASGGSGTPYTDDSNSYVTASRTPDGTLAVIYASHGTTFTIDESKMTAGYVATWVDPKTCATSAATPGTSYNSTAKGNNSDGEADWVLVLQAPQGATVTPSVVSVVTTVGSPVISSRATASPSVVAAVASIPTPTVTTSGNATVTPTVVAAVTTVGSPVISSRATATPSVVSGVTTVGSATVATGETASPAVVSAAATVPTPAITSSAAVAPTVVAASTTIPTPTVTTAGNATATPSVVAAVASVGSPTVATGETVTPTVVNAVATVPAPSVSAGGNATVTPAVVAAVTTVGSPVLHAGETAAPAVVAAVVTVSAPAITSSAVVAPAVVAASTTTPAATVRTGSTAAAVVVSAVASVPAPAVTASGNVNITAVRVSAAATIPAPTVTSSAAIAPAVVAATATVPAPTVVASVNATVTPATVNAVTVFGPIVLYDLTATRDKPQFSAAAGLPELHVVADRPQYVSRP